MSKLTLKKDRSDQPVKRSWKPKIVPVMGKHRGVILDGVDSNTIPASRKASRRSLTVRKEETRVDRAVELSNLQRENDLLVYIHAGDKKRRDGFSREYSGRGKKFKPSTAKTLDFSANPVTGTGKYIVNERLLTSRQFYMDSNDIKKRNVASIKREIALLKANKPDLISVEEIKDAQGNTILKETNNLRQITEWEQQIRGFMAAIGDNPVPIVRGEAGKQTELEADGEVKSIDLAKTMNPYSKPANARMAAPVFGNKEEPVITISTEGMATSISAPKIVEAFSEARELPFPIALYLVCVQEGIDYRARYGITDLMILVITEEYKAKGNRMSSRRARKLFEEYKIN
ncbi:MAG: hypothetical protein ACRCTW_11165 [Lactococcus garvieae]